ncbi:MAG: UDP-N-acetylmuramate--L-alanine ligase [bacterium]|nr:UDP-N-acetylmuramate--L-alanine ligase [bacterium]
MLDFKHAHFVGIGGIGMSGIARVLLQMGHRVSGSDLRTTRITDGLERLGASIFTGHDAKNIEGADVIVVSSAVPDDNPELAAAKLKGIRIIRRGQMLSLLMNERKGIAIAGTHGKTTTTSMVASLLVHSGLHPTVVVGGELNDIGSNAKLDSGEYLVAEADESDASFVDLTPRIEIITSMDPDVNLASPAFAKCGFDYDKVQKRVDELFSDFLQRLTPEGLAVMCYDHPRVRKLAECKDSRIVTYGLMEGADITAKNINLSDFSSRCHVFVRGEDCGELFLQVPGRHNVQNALAAIAVGLEIGLKMEDMFRYLAGFRGVQRRFQVIGQYDGVTVVDDYAHNPRKIAAAINGARTGGAERVFAVFQPHRHTRTKFFADDYKKCFEEADVLLVTDIYSAGEAPIPGVTAEKLAESIRAHGKPGTVVYTPTHEDVLNYISNNCRSGDLVLFLGAGDISKCAARVQEVIGCAPAEE